MNRSNGLALFLFLLSITSGYLMSKATWVSKIGMSLFYREYNFLKIWWKGSLLILGALTAIYFLHKWITLKCVPGQAKTLHRIACFLAVTGLYFTYNDFRHTLSHRLLGERFHIGLYLFWMGWIAIALFFLTAPKPLQLNDVPPQMEADEPKSME
jgi:hypothetical protein